MIRLSVNLNKVALLRNARHTGVPDPARFAGIVHAAGAAGITLHPRPDERHIRRTDVDAIVTAIAAWRPGFELNLEGYPDERFLAIVRAARPEQITLVPDKPDAFTSDAGWKLDAAERAVVEKFIAAVKPLAARVILFCDPDGEAATRIADTGAQGLEIYTGDYAHAFRVGRAIDDRHPEQVTRAIFAGTGGQDDFNPGLAFMRQPFGFLERIGQVRCVLGQSLGHEDKTEPAAIGSMNGDGATVKLAHHATPSERRRSRWFQAAISATSRSAISRSWRGSVSR